MAFIRMGLVPDAGSSYFLPRIVGAGRALEMAMTGRTVSASEAQAMGLVSRLVPATELESVTDEIARGLSTSPLQALGLTKQLMSRIPSGELTETLEYEAQTQKIASESEEHRKAALAFLEKRRPQIS